MNALTRFARALLAVAVLATATVPAFAGASQTAFLASFVGVWTGSGTMTGSDGGNISCKLTFKQNRAKVNFSGRCNFKDMGAQTFSGTLSYNDAKGQYESRSNGKTAVGTRKGDALTFVQNVRTTEGSGTSAMTLSANSLVIDTNLKSTKGETASVHLAFQRS